jgi:hypothetical protein
LSLLWVYAVTHAGAARALGSGAVGETLEVLDEGSLAAIFGRLARPPATTRESLEGHDEVVRRLAQGHESVLPVRWGQALASEAELSAALTARRAELCEALGRVAGCIQMTLRLFGRELPVGETGDPTGEIPAAAVEQGSGSEPPHSGTGAGTRYLSSRRLLREQERSLPELQSLLSALAPLVREEKVRRELQGPLVGSVYHLLVPGRLTQYRRTVASHRRRLLPWRVSLSGPAPPWAFGPPEGL